MWTLPKIGEKIQDPTYINIIFEKFRLALLTVETFDFIQMKLYIQEGKGRGTPLIPGYGISTVL